MASYTQQLVLELLVKSNDLSKGLKQVGKESEEANQKITAFQAGASKALSFAAAAGLSVGIVGTIKKTTAAYGEFINQAATAEQVFGDSYTKITAAMKDSVEATGQSQTQFLRSTTLIAGLGKTVILQELIRNIARAHHWFEQIKAGKSFTEIAEAEVSSKRRIQQMIDLAFLAPDIIRDVLEGRQPLGFTSDWCLRHSLPSDWAEQRRLLATL